MSRRVLATARRIVFPQPLRRTRRVVCIVGMHRSGTSSLAGTLEEAGLQLGEVFTRSSANPKGNRENRDIMRLNEAVLVHNGGSWDRPPAHVTWTDEHRARRDKIIRSYWRSRLWGFKDPRTLLTLDFWREALDELEFVGTFRHPLAVADSLLRRNDGTIDRWLDLWADYNERLVQLRALHEFPILRFDADEVHYRRALLGVVESLGLSPPAQLEFFEPTLRHPVDSEAAELPGRVAELHARLCALAV